MKNKFTLGVVLVLICVLPWSVFADEASTTESIVFEETSTPIETIEVDSSTTTPTTGNDDVSLVDVPVPTEDVSIVVDEVLNQNPVDSVPLGTYISGDLYEEQTWTKENGPYYINDIYIPSGITVTVEAGTEMFVDGYVAVFGNLILNGAENNKVTMDLNPDASSWYIYVGDFSNLKFNGVSINHIDGISTYNGFINFRDVDYRGATEGIVLNHFGSLLGDRVNFEGGDFGVQVVAVDGSTINLRDSVVNNGAGSNHYMLQGYRASKLSLHDTKIIPGSSVPIIMTGGMIDLDTVTVSAGDNNGIELYPDASTGIPLPVKADITNTIISDFLGSGILAINPDLTITGSKILNNGIGIESYASSNFSLSVTNSTAVENITGMVFGVQDENAKINFDVRNNWWGDRSGPFVVGRNDEGFGDEIVGYTEFARNKIRFDPWLSKEPNKRNPVVIIPGIMGSYLNKDDEDKMEVWPNLKKAFLTRDSYLDDLMLNNDGKLTVSNNIISNDIFRILSFLGKDSNFFDGLISTLKSKGYEEDKDLFVFPYDWRLDVVDSVNGVEHSKVESLKSKIDKILNQSKSDRVDIIAHSMGGLLAKYYIKNVGGDNVDKFIDIGTPHLGAPKAAKVLVYGDDMDIRFAGLGINPLEIKKISQNFPSTYNLLPSSRYFDPTLPDYSYYLYDLGDVAGDGIMGRLSYDNTKSFLKNTGRNDLLIQNAEMVHKDLDDFNPVDYGVDSYNVVGCGVPTIGKIFTNSQKFEGDFHYQIKYISGDGTVPQRSAEGMGANRLFYANDIQHATMPSQGGIRNLVASILGDDVDNFDYSTNANIKTDTANCTLPDGKIISIHSPVSLNIYDDAGRHTGPDENGDIEYEIDGVTYDTLDGNKFAFIPDGLNYIIKFNATGVGSAGVDVQEYRNGKISKSESFENIPIQNLDTKGEVIVGDAGTKILLDKGNDGEITTLTPTIQIDGDLPEVSSVANTPVVALQTVASSISSGSIVGQTMSKTDTEVPDVDPIKDVRFKDMTDMKRESRPETDSVVASSTAQEVVELKDTDTSGLASPAGFFGSIASRVWDFILLIFNKVISLFK